MKIFIKVHPNSKEEKVVKKDDAPCLSKNAAIGNKQQCREALAESLSLDVRVKAPPQEGKANKAVINVLAKHFGVPKNSIIIKAGHSSKNKIIEII